MFRCSQCNRVSKPREKSVRQVTKRRPRVHRERRNGSLVITGEGMQIVTERVICQECA